MIQNPDRDTNASPFWMHALHSLFVTLSELPCLVSLEMNLRHAYQPTASSFELFYQAGVPPVPRVPSCYEDSGLLRAIQIGGMLDSFPLPRSLSTLSLHGQQLRDSDIAVIGCLQGLSSLGLDWRLCTIEERENLERWVTQLLPPHWR